MPEKKIICQDFEEEYLPMFDIQQRGRKKKSSLNNNQWKNSSKWTSEQNIKFSNFIKSNHQILICPIKRKEERVFLKMSEEITSRSPDQCRSHHQKMIKYHDSLEGIIENIEKRYKRDYDEYSLQQSSFIQEQNLLKETEIELIEIFETKIEFQEQNESIEFEKIWEVINCDVWTESNFFCQ